MNAGAPILEKHLDVMVSAIPIVTDHLAPGPFRLLIGPERSGPGSVAGGASRKKA